MVSSSNGEKRHVGVSQGNLPMQAVLAITKFRVRKASGFSQGYVSDFELVQSMKLAGSLKVTAEGDRTPRLSEQNSNSARLIKSTL